MELSCEYVFVIIATYLMGVVESACQVPETPAGQTVVGSLKSEYEVGDVITYSCGGGTVDNFGTTYIKCRETAVGVSTWSSPDRQCSDAIAVDGGSIGGLCVASFNIIAVIVAIVVTKIWYSEVKEVEDVIH